MIKCPVLLSSVIFFAFIWNDLELFGVHITSFNQANNFDEGLFIEFHLMANMIVNSRISLLKLVQYYRNWLGVQD